jgi:hypothetical protein
MVTQTSKEGGTISKTEAVRQALAELGNDAPMPAIQAYVKDHFGIEMPKNHYYACKTRILQMAAKKQAAAKKAQPRALVQPAAASSSSAPTKKATASRPILMEDILLVKELVGRVGSDKLKSVIDLLDK